MRQSLFGPNKVNTEQAPDTRHLKLVDDTNTSTEPNREWGDFSPEATMTRYSFDVMSYDSPMVDPLDPTQEVMEPRYFVTARHKGEPQRVITPGFTNRDTAVTIMHSLNFCSDEKGFPSMLSQHGYV